MPVRISPSLPFGMNINITFNTQNVVCINKSSLAKNSIFAEQQTNNADITRKRKLGRAIF